MDGIKKNIADLTNELQTLKDENNSLKANLIEAEADSNIYKSLYHSVLSSTPDAIALTDTNGIITSTSPNVAKLLGYDNDYNFITHSILEYIDISDHSKAIADIQKMASGEKATPKEYTAIKPDGSKVYIEINNDVIRDKEGKPVQFLVVIHDITQRKRTTEALKKSEQRYQSTLDNMMEGCQIISFDWVYLYLNDTAVQNAQRPKEELINHTIHECFPGFEKTPLFSTLKHCMEERIVNSFEDIFIFPDGEKVWFEFRVQPVPEGIFILSINITNRKLAEEKILNTTRKLEHAQLIAKIGSWDNNLITGEISWSDEMYKIMGIPKGKTIKIEDIHALFSTEELDRFKHATQYSLKEDAPYSIDLKITRADNSEIYIHDEGVLIRDEEGDPIWTHGTTQDITERKQAEILLQESEEKIRQQNERMNVIINAIPDLIFVLDKKGNFLEYYASSTGTMMAPSDQIIGNNVKNIFGPDIGKLHIQKLEECIQVKELVTYEYFAHRENSLVYLEARLVPLDNNKVMVFGRNITDKKLKDIELLKLSQVVEQSPNSIFITDLDANIEYANKAFYYTTGYNSDEVLGHKPSILKSGEMDDSIYKTLWETITSGETWNGELINKKKNGEFIWENVSITPIKDNEGRIINYLAIKKDISQRKEHEKKVLELNTTLEKEIIETNLAKEKAEESDRLKSAFLANMSHEIRTPLNAILGFTQLLTTDIETPPEVKEEFWSIINRSSDNLLQIINDILDISKLETKQVNIKKKSHDISQTLEELHLIFQKKLADAGNANIELKLISPKKAVWLKTDNNRLTQIFTNLLNNSIKFTEKGKIKFGISKVTKDKIIFFVSDTGIGIKKEYQSTIYDRFRQGDESTTRAYGGAGLGLAIVKNLIELIGGDISVKSEEGKGTKTTFFLNL